MLVQTLKPGQTAMDAFVSNQIRISKLKAKRSAMVVRPQLRVSLAHDSNSPGSERLSSAERSSSPGVQKIDPRKNRKPRPSFFARRLPEMMTMMVHTPKPASSKKVVAPATPA